MNYITGKKRVDDKLGQQDIHLLKPIMGLMRYTHGQKPEVMHKMLSAWTE